MKNLNNKVAAITGTASGIGQELALQLAAAGATVAIADINENGLHNTYKQIINAGGKVSKHLLDVSQKEAVYDFADAVVQEHGQVDIIINNAGVALSGISVEDVTYEQLEWIFGINLWGVIYGTKAFLPYIKQRPEGAIINISSVFGLSGIPHQSPYCMTKFAVRGLTESLRGELMDTNILVMQVHPGGIKTDIVRNSRGHKSDKDKADMVKQFDDEAARTSAADAATVIIKGLKKNKPRVRIGLDARIFDLTVRLSPVGGVRAIAKNVLKNRKE